jgi:type VI secretion system protein ImpA
LEEAARAKPEQRFGTTIKPAEDPNWPQVVDLAQGLLLRSKDLRVAVHLTRAIARVEGIPGLASGLALIHGLLDHHWDHLHPLLDTDNGNDATERINALAALSDPAAIVRDLRDADLIKSREHGQLQARAVEVALGRLPAPRNPSPGTLKSLPEIHAQIGAAFANDRAVLNALYQARDHVRGIQTLVADRVGADRGIDLKPLAQPLDSLIEACDVGLGLQGGTAQADGGTPQEGADPNQAPRPGRFSIQGEIGSREEAVRVLDLVCTYLERHEPSNPAPLFIRRAQRLMTKSFIEIVKDLMPDSLSNLEKLAGEAIDKKKS